MFQTRQSLAKELLELSRSQLLMHFRFLAPAAARLQLQESENVTFACDGKVLYYAPKAVLEYYRKEKNYMNRLFLHCMLHCMLQHMYAPERFSGIYWNLACDVAVEKLVLSLEQPYLSTWRDSGQKAALEKLEQELPDVTAERLFYFWKKNPPSESDLGAMAAVFEMDDHSGWGAYGSAKDPQGDENDSLAKKEGPDGGEREEWEKIAKKALIELSDFSENASQDFDALIQQLKAVTRQRYDYRRFLHRFFSLGEVMKMNLDEFDYIFYTYGLSLYGNVPLVEPLEYREEKRIREFAIVIDTSGSVKGEMVQSFLQHTYNIMMQDGLFFDNMNLHLLQCDSRIQEDKKLTSPHEMEQYIRTMDIKGLGRTDFRPAFEYVHGLMQSGELQNMKGLLYFTDGDGIYPKQKPPFETAFVFLENGKKEPQTPPWAMKLILDERTLLE